MGGKALLRAALVALLAIAASGCAETQLAVHMTKRLEGATDNSAAAGGRYKIGNPYTVDGVVYQPREDFFYDETGIASWYGPGFHGNRTADGDRYDMNALTGAHPTLQMPCKVQVTNLENGRSIAVVVNDRGPYKRGRIIDLSRRAAQLLGFAGQGTARVRVQALPEESWRMAVAAGRKGPMPVMIARLMKEEAPVEVAALPADAAGPPAPAPQAAPAVAVPAAVATVRPAVTPAVAEIADPAVSVAPVHPTAIYVQAGAFSQYANADRLRARLASVGKAAITPVRVGTHRLWRVRVGPLPSVQDADQTLGRVVGLGYREARLVVD